jgi:hypothetical protein
VFARGNWRARVYSYDRDGRLTGCEHRGTNPPYGDIHDFRDVECDARGAIVRVYRRHLDVRRTLEFERPASGDPLAARRKELLARLDQHRLPPRVGVGRQSQRVAFADRHGDDAPDFIWNPAEWASGEIELGLDPELLSLCESVNQGHLAERALRPGRRIPDRPGPRAARPHAAVRDHARLRLRCHRSGRRPEPGRAGGAAASGQVPGQEITTQGRARRAPQEAVTAVTGVEARVLQT